MSWRDRARGAVERLLVISGLPSATIARLRGDTLILAYHNIIPDGELPAGDRSLHLPRRAFVAHLDALVETHNIVSLDDVVKHVPAGSSRPRAVITFDDAYRGAVTVGVAELAARSLPATIFVSPAFVGGGTFWWDVLTPPFADSLDPAFRSRALREWRGIDAVVRAGALECGLVVQPVPDYVACASENELLHAAAHDGISFAAHTWSHPNLALLEDAELRAELVRPLSWLRERFGRVISALSYPYGLSTTVTEHAAAQAGYHAAFRISGGWLRGVAQSSYALPRLNVPAGVSPHGFLLRASGVLGG